MRRVEHNDEYEEGNHPNPEEDHQNEEQNHQTQEEEYGMPDLNSPSVDVDEETIPVVKDPPIQRRTRKTSHRYQMVVEKAVAKNKKKGSTNGATGQGKGKKRTADSANGASGKGKGKKKTGNGANEVVISDDAVCQQSFETLITCWFFFWWCARVILFLLCFVLLYLFVTGWGCCVG